MIPEEKYLKIINGELLELSDHKDFACNGKMPASTTNNEEEASESEEEKDKKAWHWPKALQNYQINFKASTERLRGRVRITT